MTVTDYIRKKTVCIVLIVAISVLGTGCSADGSGAEGIQWEHEINIATGSAYIGRWRMNNSDWRYVDDPSVHVKENGVTGVVWVNQSNKDVYFQSYDSSGKSLIQSPVNVSGTPDTFSWLPDVIVTNDTPAHVYVFWQEIIFSGGTHGGEAFFARSTDGGNHFDDPINLSNSIAGDGKGRIRKNQWHNGSLDLERGPDGTIYVAWTEYEGRLWFSRSTDRGNEFSKPVQLNSGEKKPARGPSMAVNDDGTVYLVWTVGQDSDADIRFTKINSSGEIIGTKQVLHNNKQYSDAPKIGVGTDDTLHIVYGESHSGPLKRYRIHYTKSSNDGDSWSKPRNISAHQSEIYSSVNYPSLSIDQKNNVYVLWELFANYRKQPRGLGMTVSKNAGESFNKPIAISSISSDKTGFNGSAQGYLSSKLSVNKSGTIAVINSIINPGEQSSIWLIRGKLR